MITSLRLVNFKNFADETLRLGPFTVIVGANASGKSNIRDAFRFLHGIGRGYTLAEILGGKYRAGRYVEWPGIRGAMYEIIRLGQQEFSVALEGVIGNTTVDYTVNVEYDEFRSAAFRVTHEELRGCVRSLGHVLEWRYETQTIPQRPDRRTVGCSGFPTPISQDRGKATYCRPTGGRQRHCVRSAQRLHVASHAA